MKPDNIDKNIGPFFRLLLCIILIVVLFIVAIILSSGCLSEKEFSGDELCSIALENHEVIDLINGYQYEIADFGPAELNGQDVYYVKLSIDAGQKNPITYSVFIDKTGKVIHISKEFPTIDPGTIEH